MSATDEVLVGATALHFLLYSNAMPARQPASQPASQPANTPAASSQSNHQKCIILVHFILKFVTMKMS